MSAQTPSEKEVDKKTVTPKTESESNLFNLPLRIVKSIGARVCVLAILLMSFVTNILILKQIYTDQDEQFKQVASETVDTMTAFLIITLLVVLFMIRKYFYAVVRPKAIIFTIFVVWMTLPQILLISRGTSSSAEFLMNNAWVSVFFSIIAFLWIIMAWLFGTAEYRPKYPDDKCIDVGGWMDLGQVHMKYMEFSPDNKDNHSLEYCDKRTGYKGNYRLAVDTNPAFTWNLIPDDEKKFNDANTKNKGDPKDRIALDADVNTVVEDLT